MVAATYTSDLTDIFLFESTTGVTAYGGGAGGLGASPDYSIQGTNAVDKQIDNAEKGFLYTAGAAFTIGADDHFFIWCTVAVFGLANTRDNRGIVVGIGDDTSNFVKFHVNGSDTLPKGGMLPYAVRFDNTTLANRRTLVGAPGTSPDSIGVGAFTTGTAKFSNLGGDAARIGTGYDILNGTGADPEADFSGIASDDEGTAEGIFQTTNGGFLLQGKLRVGSAGTACEFLDSNTNIFAVANLDGHALPDFTEILIENASSILTLTNVNFEALGTHNRGRMEMLTATATLTLSNVGFIGWGETVLGSGATFTGCRWVGSDQITCDGASLPNGTVSGFEDLRIIDAQDETSYDNSPTTEGTFAGGTGYAALDTITLSDGSVITVDAVSAGVVTQFTVSTTNTFGRAVNGTALTQVATSGSGTGFTLTPEADNLGDRSSLVWNNAADPNGELDGMSFTKGTAAAHAIELGTTSPLSMTFTDVTSSGYNAANGNNDSFFHVKRTSGTVTINIAGGSGNFSYKTDGATVNVVTSVPLTITVKDASGTAIENARVIVVDRSTDPPTEHMNELTTAAGVATEAYGGSTPLAIEIEVRRGDGTGGINYFPVKVPETITSSGLTNTVTLLVDPINSTPTSTTVENTDTAEIETDLTTYTFSSMDLGAAQSDRHIVVAVHGRNTSGASTVDTVTVGGTSATEAIEVQNTDSSNRSTTALYIAAVPTGATGDVVVTFSTGQIRAGVGVFRVTGIDSATATDTDSDASSTTALNVTLTLPTGGVVIAASSHPLNDTATWTNITEQYDFAFSTTTFYAVSGASDVVSSGGDVSLTCTWSGAGAENSSAVFAAWT